jgi:uncharacterized membrane protein
MFRAIFDDIMGIERRRADMRIFGAMAVSGALSLLASFVLSIEAMQLAKAPDAALSCNLNAVVNCASVMNHPTADLFGFPNSFLGLISEPIVITVAVAGFMGVKFPRVFMFMAQIGYSIGLLFALYLLYVSVFVIGVLCPWCLLVTISTTLVFASLLHYNIREENLYLPKKTSDRLRDWFKKGYDAFVVALLLAAMVFLVLFRYNDSILG